MTSMRCSVLPVNKKLNVPLSCMFLPAFLAACFYLFVHRWKTVCLYCTRLWQAVHWVLEPLQAPCCAHTLQALCVHHLWQDIQTDINISHAPTYSARGRNFRRGWRGAVVSRAACIFDRCRFTLVHLSKANILIDDTQSSLRGGSQYGLNTEAPLYWDHIENHPSFYTTFWNKGPKINLQLL